MENPILVSIICCTYNHEPYIRQCIDGFIMQKTTFRFEVLIHDDASIDGTQSIIREYEAKYPDIIKPIYQVENQYSKKTGILKTFQYPRVKGKYVAFCEGDDYWIDPMKLQSQVDIMEKNEEYGLCYTKTKYLYNETNRFIYDWGGPSTEFRELLKANTIPTLSVMIRWDYVRKYYAEIAPYSDSWRMGDYPMWLWLAYHYKVCYIDKVTSVYRVLNESASHSKDVEKKLRFILSSIDIQEFFANRYGVNTGVDYVELRIQAKMYNYALYGKGKLFADNWKMLLEYSKLNLLCLFPYKYLLFFIFPRLRKKYLIH